LNFFSLGVTAEGLHRFTTSAWKYRNYSLFGEGGTFWLTHTVWALHYYGDWDPFIW